MPTNRTAKLSELYELYKGTRLQCWRLQNSLPISGERLSSQPCICGIAQSPHLTHLALLPSRWPMEKSQISPIFEHSACAAGHTSQANSRPSSAHTLVEQFSWATLMAPKDTMYETHSAVPSLLLAMLSLMQTCWALLSTMRKMRRRRHLASTRSPPQSLSLWW